MSEGVSGPISALAPEKQGKFGVPGASRRWKPAFRASMGSISLRREQGFLRAEQGTTLIIQGILGR